MATFNYERAAVALVEAAYYGDGPAAKRYRLSERSIRNYRKRLENDIDLAALFLIKKQQFEDGWAEELPGAIRAAIRFLGKAANAADPCDHQAIHSVAGALKILADVTLTKKVLDARLTGRGEPERAEDRALASEAFTAESSEDAPET